MTDWCDCFNPTTPRVEVDDRPQPTVDPWDEDTKPIWGQEHDTIAANQALFGVPQWVVDSAHTVDGVVLRWEPEDDGE